MLAALVTLGLTPAVAEGAAEGPVFVGGEAQPVFDPKDVVRESVWVRAPVDSDRDGHDDEVYTEVVRQKATDRGLKVPVVFFNSPYFSGGNDVANRGQGSPAHVRPVPGEPLLRRGQLTYNIYCAPCHGNDGAGRSGDAELTAHVRRVADEEARPGPVGGGDGRGEGDAH